jgi:hypothetical protein
VGNELELREAASRDRLSISGRHILQRPDTLQWIEHDGKAVTVPSARTRVLVVAPDWAPLRGQGHKSLVLAGSPSEVHKYPKRSSLVSRHQN